MYAGGSDEEIFDLEHLESIPVIDFRVLKEVWPHGNWKERITNAKNDSQIEGENNVKVMSSRLVC